MLQEKILLNQSVNNSVRDQEVPRTNQNTTDQKFEDAMYQSRQAQLSAEKRQSAARNDLAQQSQRQQQEQAQARLQAERKAQSQQETNNTKQETTAKADTNTNESDTRRQDTSSAQENKSANVDEPKNQELASASNSEQESKISEMKQPAEDEQTSSWLDTFMKIVANDDSADSKDVDSSSDKFNLEDKSVTFDPTESELLSQAFIDKNAIDKDITDKSFNIEQVIEAGPKVDEAANTESKLSSEFVTSENTDLKNELTDDANAKAASVTGVDESSDSSADESAKLATQLSGELKQDAPTSLASNANADIKNAQQNTEFKYDKSAELTRAAAAVNNALQQDAVTDKNALLEPTASKVVNFANPMFAELNKDKTLNDNAKMTSFEQQLEALKSGSSDSNVSEDKLESETKVAVETRAVTSMLNNIDPINKTNETNNKTDVVDVNGVQLDKTLQLPKQEHSSQVKNEALLRENILFNKQELANHMQQQVGIMMSKNMKSVDIRLDPPELGTIQIKLSMNNDQAAVSFVVSNQQAKDALESSIPRLKEMLEQQGMDLAESDVHHGSSQDNAQGDSDSSGGGNGGLNSNNQEDEKLVAQEAINRAIQSPWNVDYYA